MKLYMHPLSGHAHRARLFLSLLGLEHALVEVDLLAGAHKQPDFLALNCFGQVPVLVDGDVTVADSNGILVYLASRYDRSHRWYPSAPAARAAVQRWLSVAAGQIASGPAAARLVTVFGAGLDHAAVIARAHSLLKVMEGELSGRDWLVDGVAGHEGPTIADVAGHTYIAHAPEGGVDLEPYPAVRAWLRRLEALDGFVPMKATAISLAG